MSHPAHYHDDTRLFDAIRRMWEHRDPVPPGLVDDVLVAIATADLDRDVALLLLVSDSVELAGARSPVGVRVLEFTEGDTSVMLRVDTLDGDLLRVDGWMVPALPGGVVLTADGVTHRAVISGEGRFELSGVARGTAVLRFEPAGADDTPFGTEPFEL